jgi:hypothetical protein
MRRVGSMDLAMDLVGNMNLIHSIRLIRSRRIIRNMLLADSRRLIRSTRIGLNMRLVRNMRLRRRVIRGLRLRRTRRHDVGIRVRLSGNLGRLRCIRATGDAGMCMLERRAMQPLTLTLSP